MSLNFIVSYLYTFISKPVLEMKNSLNPSTICYLEHDFFWQLFNERMSSSEIRVRRRMVEINFSKLLDKPFNRTNLY